MSELPTRLEPDPAQAEQAWVARELASRGIGLAGPGERLHSRVWSSATRFGTTGGPVWLKVNGVGTAHEPALLDLLHTTSPGLSPDVIAIDVRRRWSLCHDAGPRLRDVAVPQEQWSSWERVVVRYADLQLQLADHREEVLATGVREVGPRTVPRLAEELVAALAPLDPGEGGLTPSQAEGLHAVLPRLDAWCAELAGCGIPDSVQHDDLHSGNLCWPGPVQSARIIDWGDASWGCPLSTLLSLSSALSAFAEVTPDAAPVLRVRDAYLEPFTAFGDRAELVRWADLAQRIGCVAKALSWRAALVEAPPDLLRELEFPVREWLLDLVAAPPDD